MDASSFGNLAFGTAITAAVAYAVTQVIQAKSIAQKSRNENEEHITKNEQRISELTLSTEKTIAQIRSSMETSLNMLRQDQHNFQMKTVETFATNGYLREVELRIMRCLEQLDAKFDRMIERQQRDD